MSQRNVFPSPEGVSSVASPPPKTERRTIVARDAATNEVLGEVPCWTKDEAFEAVRKARDAQREWSRKSVSERLAALEPVYDLIIARRDELARALSREVGKPRIEALSGEVFGALEAFRYYLSNAESLLGPRKISHSILKTTVSYYHHEPYGVVALITPWNYPFLISISIGVSALIAGNAVVNKPSEYTPLIGLEVEKIFREAGLPAGLWQCVPGYGEVGAALIDAQPDKVSFTGSVATGRKVGGMCGERLIPVSLELGGKDPAIVLDDAPLDRAVKALTWGAFCNSGQICASIERIYVQEGVAKAFTDKLVEEVKKLRQGPDRNYDVDVGSMANRMQWEIVNRQVEEAKAHGASVLTGGHGKRGDAEKGGWFYEPTILTRVTDDMAVQRDETFGPVVTIVPVSGEDEAVKRANDSVYGLSASVWTQNNTVAARIAKNLNFGAVFVNDHLVPSGAGEVSWGGVKQSGFGKTRGPDGLLAMTRVKHVSYERLKGFTKLPVWYPYSKAKYKLFSNMIPVIFARSAVKRVGSLWRVLRGKKRTAGEKAPPEAPGL